MSPSLTAVISLILLLSFPIHSLSSPYLQSDCATSAKSSNQTRSPSSPSKANAGFTLSSDFLSTVRSTIDDIQKLISVVSGFSGGILGGDLRLSSAVSDCLDLLDLSSDELSSTLSSTGGTGNRRSDLQSWLSAALGNQGTCQESLDGTDGILRSLIGTGLDAVSNVIADGLRQVAPSGGHESGGGRRRLLGGTHAGRESFPAWVRPVDRRLLQAVSPPAASSVDATVAQDGSGTYTTVGDAVAAAPVESGRRWVIYVKKGVYMENVEIKKKKWNLMLIGDGMDVTVISGSRNFVDGWTTYRSATFAVSGKGLIARDLTIENTAGPSKHQAVALRSDSDLSVYYRCSFRGYQDTLYTHSLRQFYRDCRISGTVDFIFGNAAAIFQNCQIFARLPLPDQKNTVTAQGRKDPNQNTGFSLQFCNISADSDLASAGLNGTPTYLGRPWKEYSRTVIMQSYIGPVIRPEGWLPWQGDFALNTLYYAEYMNFGPGSVLSNRVNWPGYHVITDSAQAVNFTVAQFIDGNLWLPSTGVKFSSGLSE